MVNRALIVILATVTLDAVGIGLALPVIPTLLRELSHETRIAGRFGYFMAIYPFMQFLFSPVLGTLSDYAGNATRAYVRAARQALAVADRVVFIGPHAFHARRVDTEGRPERLRMFATVREAAEHFEETLRSGDLVVLKGSNTADHLGRIALLGTTDVRCWRTDCHRMNLCDECGLLSVPER